MIRDRSKKLLFQTESRIEGIEVTAQAFHAYIPTDSFDRYARWKGAQVGDSPAIDVLPSEMM